MPITVKKLMEMQETATIEYFGEKADVVYRPGTISEKMFDDVSDLVNAADEDDEAVNELNLLLSRVVVSWDVIGEDGKPVPLLNGKEDEPSPALRGLPLPFRSSVLMQVVEHAQGKARPSGQSSRRGSLRRGR